MTLTSTSAEVRPARRATRTVLMFFLVLPGLLWALVRLSGQERGPLVQLFAYTPYAALWAWVPVVIALRARRWLATAAAVLAALVLAVCVLPRALPDAHRGPATGVRVTVMTINMFVGAADPASVVKLVRDHDVAVLAVQEFTPRAREGLTAAGLDTLLPYHSLAEEWDPTGSGLYSRFPISAAGSARAKGNNQQAYATVQPPGATALAVQSAHPLAPYAVSALADWRAGLAAEPVPDPDGPPRILLGDFNSTLDHAPIRHLIDRGYRDAADTVGEGLVPTWGPWYHHLPPVTLDHVLVDERVGVRDVSVHGVTGSDHRAVIATLTVPAA
ncbi:endonuclease/exonuclease/phosphatase family metal-dependent hydrolase [Actinoplanes tereljensis]|uniref:Endonuclease n=1 Tax=Paractinoplanes tereljensis TaxID=571912 RepID=A0A919TQ30_9ACTN|nr:endonuclease/exonuclease/phosphatase family protein [Actinoplanes tereljensis]GIF18663.1 endonuclease [Actinoplanes tereljensis]